MRFYGFPHSSVGKESACKAGDPGSIPGSGRFPWRRQRLCTPVFLGLPGGSAGKDSGCKAGDLGSIPWRRERLPTPVFWPGEFHGSNLGFLQVECLARSHQGSTPFPTTLYTITVAKITNSISLQRQTSRDIVGSVLDHRP